MSLRTQQPNRQEFDWPALGEYLASTETKLLPATERIALYESWSEITRLEESLDDALMLALIGGTGVGKSTLINAIAGQAISRSGDRRPTTNRVVLYIHRDTELPPEVPTSDFSEPHMQHGNPRMRKLVLLDFPDFDSAESTHAEILRRHLPHLDVLLVVVDDVKYADLRLYELLRSLEQDADNVFVVLNKIDRLRNRYDTQAPKVIAEILADLRAKLKEHSGLDLPASHFQAISAREVLQQRLAASSARVDPAFAALEELLDSFQEEKRRRLAKERNLLARKAHLIDQLRDQILTDDNLSTLAALRDLVASSKRELEVAVAAIPTEILNDGERRGARGSWMRVAGRAWGIPISLFFTLLGELPSWRRSLATEPTDLAARIERHYIAYVEAARNLGRRFNAELVGSPWATTTEPDSIRSPQTSRCLRQAAQTLQQGLNPAERGSHFSRRLAIHLPALLLLVTALAAKFNAVRATNQSLIGWSSQLLSFLSPLWITNLILGVILAYLVTAVVTWLMEIQRLEGSIGRSEKLIRESILSEGGDQLGQLAQRLQLLESELERVKRMI